MIDWSIIFLVFVGSFIGAVGTLIVKKSTSKYPIQWIWKSIRFWYGLVLYGFATIFYVIALRKGELSLVYPLVSITYVWTTVFSVKYLNEEINKWKVLGLIGIVIGIAVIGIGS